MSLHSAQWLTLIGVLIDLVKALIERLPTTLPEFSADEKKP